VRILNNIVLDDGLNSHKQNVLLKQNKMAEKNDKTFLENHMMWKLSAVEIRPMIADNTGDNVQLYEGF
jgi:hypothetical protein